jgi:hypothetical protein
MTPTTTTPIDTAELTEHLVPLSAPGRIGQLLVERTKIREHLAVAAAGGWIVQDRDGMCWWADDDGLWYLQGEATDLIHSMLTAEPGQ